jgi:hypothetical protein
MENNGSEMRKNGTKGSVLFQKWWIFPLVFPQFLGFAA